MPQYIPINKIEYPKDVKDDKYMLLLTKLIEISEMLDYIDTLPIIPSYADEVKKDEKIKSIRGTTGIEGNVLDEDEIRKVLDEKGATSIGDLETINSGEVHDFIIDFCIRNPDVPISEAVIKQIHTLNTKDIPYLSNRPGEYRNFTTNFGYPPKETFLKTAQDIEIAMKELIDWINNGETIDYYYLPWVVKGILAHYAITNIHPFGDGNGRTARAVEALIFCHMADINDYCFYGIANYCYRNRNQYIEELAKVDMSSDASDLLLFCLNGFHESISYVKNRITNIIAELMFMDYAHFLRRSGQMTKKAVEVLDVIVKMKHLLLTDYYKRYFTDRSGESKRRYLKKFLEYRLIKIDKTEHEEIIMPSFDVLKTIKRLV